MNKPYVKEYDSEGNLVNPIKGIYKHSEKNRAYLRYKHPRAMNNRRTTSLTVMDGAPYSKNKTGNHKYYRSIQAIRTKTCIDKEIKVSVKYIVHYILANLKLAV